MHTPGPWFPVVHHGKDGHPKMFSVRSGTLHHDLCHVLDGLGSKHPEDDCRLIGAAPDLYASAKKLDHLMLVIESAVRHADPAHHAAVMALLAENSAAIAKATTPPSPPQTCA